MSLRLMLVALRLYSPYQINIPKPTNRLSDEHIITIWPHPIIIIIIKIDIDMVTQIVTINITEH